MTESLNLDGVPVTLVDTAGIAERTDDAVERLGVERSHAEIGRADVVLLVLDGAVGPSPEDAAIAAAIGERPGVVVFNKVDLPPRYPPAAAQALLAAAPVCTVSRADWRRYRRAPLPNWRSSSYRPLVPPATISC